MEDTVAAQIAAAGLQVKYEEVRLAYVKPSKPSTYRPDFILPNGIIVETKGRFLTEDRQKHKLLQEQHPDLDLRFVFSRSSSRLTKASKTTYADWCRRYGFRFADARIPPEWFAEPYSEARWKAIEAATKH